MECLKMLRKLSLNIQEMVRRAMEGYSRQPILILVKEVNFLRLDNF